MRTRMLALMVLLFVGGGVGAANVTVHPYTPAQTGGSISLGLIVRGWTSWFQLSVAGGWELACDWTSLTLEEERSLENLGLPGQEIWVTVPAVVPASYVIPSFSAVPANTCRSCTFKSKGFATDGSASITAGAGISITFSPGAPQIATSTLVTGVCRQSRPPQCCGIDCVPP